MVAVECAAEFPGARSSPIAAATHREERPFRCDERRKAVGLPSMVVRSGLTMRWPANKSATAPAYAPIDFGRNVNFVRKART